MLAMLALAAGSLRTGAVWLGREAGGAGGTAASALGAGGRGLWRWTVQRGLPAVRRRQRVVADRATSAAELVLSTAAAMAVAGFDRATHLSDRIEIWAGIRLDRVLQAVVDAVAVAVVVGGPSAWRWLRREGWHTGLLMATASQRAWGAARPRLPGVGRGAALSAGSLAGAVALALALVHPTVVAAASLVDTGRFPPLTERSVVRAADGSVLARWHGRVDRKVVPLRVIPEHVRHAVISAEDTGFRRHDGYDLSGMARALWANVRAGDVVQGGSTITQQLAKRTYTGDDVTVWRKIRELIYAVSLERDHTKDELLARYLNEVYFGSGAYGVAAAAEQLFATAPEDLSVSQGAVLAGLIRSPGALDPREDTAAVRRRRNDVLARMAAEGHLSPQRARHAAAKPLGLAARPPQTPDEPHVVDAVWRELRRAPALGPDPEARAERLRTGGLDIHTSIDPQLQDRIDQAVAAHLPARGPSAGVAAVDPRTGRVRALHGGADSREFGLATQARRQPGSTIKPFVAAAVLQAGHDPDEPLEGDAVAAFDTDGETWRVGNYAGAAYDAPDLGRALRQSINTAFADLVTDYGVAGVVDVLDSVGVDIDAALGPPSQRGPSIALGGMTHGVSPLELASAYTPFATRGAYAQPHLVTRVAGRDGKPVVTPGSEPSQVLPVAVADRVGRLLRGVVRQGTGTPAQVPGAEVMGKTGTTTDGADAWFVGGDRSLMTAVWVGHPRGRTPQPRASGSTVAAPLWRDAVGPTLTR